MRVLDRYLLRELFVPIFICSLTLVFLVLILSFVCLRLLLLLFFSFVL